MPSGSSNCFFLQKEYDSKMYKCPGPVIAVPFYFVHPYSKRNIDELSLFLKGTNREFVSFATVNLFEANWFATGNKSFLGQIFRTAQGKTTARLNLKIDLGTLLHTTYQGKASLHKRN